MRIILIDKEPDLLEALTCVIESICSYEILQFNNINNYNPIFGDLVIYDMYSVENIVKIEGIKYLSMSADPFIDCDITKPFCSKDLQKIINLK